MLGMYRAHSLQLLWRLERQRLTSNAEAVQQVVSHPDHLRHTAFGQVDSSICRALDSSMSSR